MQFFLLRTIRTAPKAPDRYRGRPGRAFNTLGRRGLLRCIMMWQRNVLAAGLVTSGRRRHRPSGYMASDYRPDVGSAAVPGTRFAPLGSRTFPAIQREPTCR